SVQIATNTSVHPQPWARAKTSAAKQVRSVRHGPPEKLGRGSLVARSEDRSAIRCDLRDSGGVRLSAPDDVASVSSPSAVLHQRLREQLRIWSPPDGSALHPMGERRANARVERAGLRAGTRTLRRTSVHALTGGHQDGRQKAGV